MPHWLEKVAALLQAETSDLRELARLANGSEKTFYLGIDISDLDLSKQDLRGMEFTDFVERHLIRIKKAPRREERLVLVLDCLIYDRDRGIQLLKAYSGDKSFDVSEIVDGLKRAVGIETSRHMNVRSRPELDRHINTLMERQGRSEIVDSVLLVDFLRKSLSKALPTSRDYLFYYMAKHLSKYPEVKQYLRNKYSRARGTFSLTYPNTGRKQYDLRGEIEQYLFSKEPLSSLVQENLKDG